MLQDIDLKSLTVGLCDREMSMSAYAAHRTRELQMPAKLIQSNKETDLPIRPPPTKLRPFVIRSPTPSTRSATTSSLTPSSQNVSITSTVMRPTSAPADMTVKQMLVKQESSLSGQQLSSLVSSRAAIVSNPSSKYDSTVTTVQVNGSNYIQDKSNYLLFYEQ